MTTASLTLNVKCAIFASPTINACKISGNEDRTECDEKDRAM